DAVQGTTMGAVFEAGEDEYGDRQCAEGPPDALAELRWYAGKAQRTVGERGQYRRGGQQANGLAEGEGDDGQVIAAQAQTGDADNQPEHGGHQTAYDQRDDKAQPEQVGRGERVPTQGQEDGFQVE